jgi:hypothetical protein
LVASPPKHWLSSVCCPELQIIVRDWLSLMQDRRLFFPTEALSSATQDLLVELEGFVLAWKLLESKRCSARFPQID